MFDFLFFSSSGKLSGGRPNRWEKNRGLVAKNKSETEVVDVPSSSGRADDLVSQMPDSGQQQQRNKTDSCSSSRTSEVYNMIL